MVLLNLGLDSSFEVAVSSRVAVEDFAEGLVSSLIACGWPSGHGWLTCE